MRQDFVYCLIGSDAMIKRIFVFRHGETDWNREGRIQGHLDIPLNATGREQALSLATQLLEHRFDKL